ncbi:hypothetical protein AOLI_G00174180 [Acnodon oligacanthus]
MTLTVKLPSTFVSVALICNRIPTDLCTPGGFRVFRKYPHHARNTEGDIVDHRLITQAELLNMDNRPSSLLKPGDDSGSHTGRVRKRVWICSQVCQSHKIGAFWMKGERQGKREGESKSPVWLAHQRKKLVTERERERERERENVCEWKFVLENVFVCAS